MGSGATAVDLLGIASAFGFAIVAMAYGIGPISGCHVNPAVSFGVFVAGRMPAAEMISYWIAQVLGAIVGAVVLYLILSGKAQGWTGGLGQNGWGPGYLGECNVVSAFVFEVVGTFLFLVCILGVAHPFAPAGFRRSGDRAYAGRYPSRRHQHHRHVGQPRPLNWSDARRRRLEYRTHRSALAVHHRASDRRRRGRLAVSEGRAAGQQSESLTEPALRALQRRAWRAKSPPCSRSMR
jgi:glycerol uptake facilitator-like aquaporin